jgi:hypothetical protein
MTHLPTKGNRNPVVAERPDRPVAGPSARNSPVGLWLALLLLACYGYFFPRWADWGVNSKVDLTMAMVDQGTFVIDDYYQNTGDYALYKGHHYSDKAPGSSFLAVPFYAVFKAAIGTSILDPLIDRLAGNPAIVNTLKENGTGLLQDKVYFAMALYVITFFVMSLPSALLGYVLYQFMGYFLQDRFSRALIVILYGLGTVAFPYSQTFNGRQTSAVMTVFAFYMLFRINRGELSRRYLWLIGPLMGWVFISDYPSVFILGALFLYAVSFLRDWRRVLPLVLGGIPPVALMALYNLSIFETPLPVGYKYSELYQDLHTQGLISITYPRLEALYGLTFSPFRGLFFLSPALLLAIPGFIYWYRRGACRAEWWVCLCSVISAFLFYSSSVMWWGGYAVGPAYLVAMIPYMVFPIAFFLRRHDRSRWVWRLVVGLTAISVLLVWAETIAGQSFPDLNPNPLFAISIPHLMAGNIARNLGMMLRLRGLPSLLPLFLFAAVVLLIIFRGRRAAYTRASQFATEVAE